MKVLFAGSDPDLVMTNSGEDRQPGVHLSDILTRMAWDRDRKYHPDAPKDLMLFEQGFTWETVLGRALSARNVRPGHRPEQFQEDGIWMSPDWLNPDADVQAEEWKSTKKSTKNLDQKVEEWLPQSRSYIRGLLRRRLITAPVMRFRIWCINGDYSYESKGDLTLLKDYYRVDIEFDKRELEENWRGIVQAGHKYGLLKAAPNELAGGRKRTALTNQKGDGGGRPPAIQQPGWLKKQFASAKKDVEERAWERRPQLEATLTRRMSQKRKAGSQPVTAPVKARVVTFRPTKRS